MEKQLTPAEVEANQRHYFPTTPANVIFKEGAEWMEERYRPILESCKEIMRFEHVIRDYAAPALQFDGNLLKALEQAKSAISALEGK